MAVESSNAPQFINFLGEKPTTKEAKTTQVEQQQDQPATEEPMSPVDRAQAGRRKRKTPRNPEEEEVVTLTPEELLATHRFECLLCNRGFACDQNLQLRMRGHNIDDWKLIKRDPNAHRRRYVCPEPKCIHHDPARSLGDIIGIKKHYSRKHCKKQFPCPNCDCSYAVIGDLKAHSKVCSTRTYSCSCGASYPKRYILINHKTLCDTFLKRTINEPSSNTCNASLECTTTPTLSLSTLIGNSDALIKTIVTSFALNSNCNEYLKNIMDGSFNAFIDKVNPSPTVNLSTILRSRGRIIEGEDLKPSLNVSISLNNNSYALLHRAISSIPMEMSNCFHRSVIHPSSWNTFNALPKGAMHTPSLNNEPLSSMPSLSLSSMPVPSSKFASMNLYASLNNPISLQTTDNHSIDDFEDDQLGKDDSYNNYELIKTLSLSKDHPMVKHPISPLVNSPCSTMPSSSTYNYLGPPVADRGKNKNKEALG